MEQKRCISSLTLEELAAEMQAMGQPAFRAKQIFHWVHQKLADRFAAMTDQPKALLAKLEQEFYIAAPTIERRQEAKDGTVKYLLRMADGNCIETVVMRYHYGPTVCVSTQVGCRMGCRFCASTQAGRVRNLEAGSTLSIPLTRFHACANKNCPGPRTIATIKTAKNTDFIFILKYIQFTEVPYSVVFEISTAFLASLMTNPNILLAFPLNLWYIPSQPLCIKGKFI